MVQIQCLSKSCNSAKYSSACQAFADIRFVICADQQLSVHCSISLPQPLSLAKMGTHAVHILNTKTVIPDCAILIPAASIRSLSHSAKSPFKILKSHSSVVNSGNASKGTSFRYQSTPCARLPDMPSFEFVSSFWEDKKPIHNMLEDAYRQNRMATTAALRHLHSLRIKTPIFGLVWASGTVRAHVDWCKCEEGKTPVSQCSLSTPSFLNEIFRQFSQPRIREGTQRCQTRGRKRVTYFTSGSWIDPVTSWKCTSSSETLIIGRPRGDFVITL